MANVNSICFTGYHQIERNMSFCALPDLKFKKPSYTVKYLAPEWKEIQNKPNPFTNTTWQIPP